MSKVIISVKVVPGASFNNVSYKIDESGNKLYLVRTTKNCENNKANEAVIELLAKYLKLAKRDVNIIRGFTSKNKLIEISNLVNN